LDYILNHSNDDNLIDNLNSNLKLAGQNRILTNYDNSSLLGNTSTLLLGKKDLALVKGIINVIIGSFDGYLVNARRDGKFEFINESFGHFVRDNFRQNIEDAQYMTPPEVVNFASRIASARVQRSARSNKPLVVCDPSCGVGSFLAQFYRVWLLENKNTVPPILVGQDKVDRMARLSRLNLCLFGIDIPQIHSGNSLFPGSSLDAYIGKCDLILTNPPFGAKFHTLELRDHSKYFFPILNDFIQSRDSQIDSELLFLDYYMELLVPNGTLFAILPDSVVSASGIPQLIRRGIESKYTIKSITELPAVTFAQAGTRTKTCLVEIEKSKTNDSIFISNIENLGFEVSTKKGVSYKKISGVNELVPLENIIIKHINSTLGSKTVVSDIPSCVIVSQNDIIDFGWTPSHFSSKRISTIISMGSDKAKADWETFKLSELVTISNESRVGLRTDTSSKCISVLHIGEFGVINYRELINYKPKYQGKPCSPGDLLISRINPRIPRIVVVPELNCKLTCSSEFEVLKVNCDISPFEIAVMLYCEVAQNQIQSLTSGTSSSHNRIKTKELMNVCLFRPKDRSELRREYDKLVEEYKTSNEMSQKNALQMFESWNKINILQLSATR
jgi:hypothetical protein